MPAKSLSKVQKHVSKKKGKSAALHENSRDSRRLRRASTRDDKLAKITSARAKSNQPYRTCFLLFEDVELIQVRVVERIAHFQSAAQEKTKPFTLQDIVAHIEGFVAPRL